MYNMYMLNKKGCEGVSVILKIPARPLDFVTV